MADKEEIKRILRRGMSPATESKVTEQQLDESVDLILQIDQPLAEDLEKIGDRVAGDPSILRGTDLQVLNEIISRMRTA